MSSGCSFSPIHAFTTCSVCVASTVSGSSRRITRIMTHTRLGLLRTVFVLLLGLGLLSLPFAAGMVNTRQVHAQAAEPSKSFEVVSIHPDPNVTNMSMDASPTPWSTTGAPLKLLISDAFSLKDFQILHAPSWINSERYTIRARLPSEMSKLPDAELGKQLGTMLQSMLIDRFHLRYHWTTQEFPVYSLVLEKGSPRVPPAAPTDKFSLVVGPNFYEAHALTMSDFADNLGGNLDRIVQDHTGLTGTYTFKLTYPPPAGTDPSINADPSSQMDSESRLFSALSDQLGLKLVAEKRPVKMLVLDDIQRPTPN